MKRILLSFLAAAVLLTTSGCATVFGGQRTAYQTTKPREGQPQREVRVGALIADILLFWPGLIVDFATGAIYRPAPRAAVEKAAQEAVNGQGGTPAPAPQPAPAPNPQPKR